MDFLTTDLRSAFRTFLNRPLFSATAVLTLAIGIGVNTVAFSALSGLLNKPQRFPAAEELGWILVKAPGNQYGSASLPDFEELRRANRTFEAITAEARVPLTMRTEAGAEQVWTLLVSSEYLSMLRAKPRLGRIFTAADLPDLPVVVSERFWNERLGGGDALAGRTLTLNGRTFGIVGVLPDGFQGPGGLFEPSMWLPLERLDVLGQSPALRTREHAWLGLAGRMKPGVTYAQAEADLQAIARQLAAEHPATNRDRVVEFAPVIKGNPEVRGIAKYGWIALGVVGIVLLIACFNVAGLLLARAAERQREMSVRAALGASRARILRQLVIEGLVLAMFGGAAALLVASWSADLLAAFSLPSPIPQRLHMPVDWRLVAFTVTLAAVGGVLPAIVPALNATRVSLLTAMKNDSPGGGKSSRARSMFVVAQIAGSTLFLAAALLFVRSFWNRAAFDPGFDTAHTLTVEVTPSNEGYDRVRARAYVDAAVERVSKIPDVRQVAIADRVPFFVGFPLTTPIPAAGEDCSVLTCRTAFEYGVGRGHFATLGIPIVAGRDFTEQEIGSGSGVVINASMAAQLWPQESAVGQWLRSGNNTEPRQVIGISGDITYHSAGRPAWHIYRPIRPDELTRRVTVIIRTAGDPRRIVPTVHQQMYAIDSNIPLYIRTMEQRMEVPLWPARTAAGFLTVCGTLALVLASVGLFGVTYYAVSRRTRELGVRVALGATRGRIMSLVLREGLMLAIPGVVLGAGAALIVGRLAASTLFGVGPADPLTFGATAMVQTAVALAACALPAWRATRVDPMIALRQE